MTEDSTPLPGTVFTPRGFRILKIAVAVMTVLMLAGIAALVYGVTLQLSKLGSGSKPEAAAETGVRRPLRRSAGACAARSLRARAGPGAGKA